MVSLNCTLCGGDYRVGNYRKNDSKYCSQKCKIEALARKIRLNIRTFCQVCGKEFFYHRRDKKRMACSRHCSGLLPGRFKKGHAPWNKGKSLSFAQKRLLQQHAVTRIGKENTEWKGDKVGYNALHGWVRKWKGKPIKCENKDCFYPRKRLGKNQILLEPKRYEWANISHEYKRDLNDWMQLCASCHRQYDRQYRKSKQKI